jgi:hypothetical protein
MKLRKSSFFIGVASIAVFFVISGFGTSFAELSTVQDKIRICKNETCLRTSELIHPTNYKDESILYSPQKEEEKTPDTSLVDILTLILMGVVPITGFLWWLVNNQQEKKITEFSLKQESAQKELLDTLLEKQEENVKHFSNELKELIAKLDSIGRSISDVKLEYVEKTYQQDLQVLKIENNLTALSTKVTNVENYLNKREDFHIRD